MMAVIRLRGTVKMRKKIADTLRMLHLDKVNTMVLIDENDSRMGMVKKSGDFVAWGEVSDELVTKLKEQDKKVFHLKPPRGGMKSKKARFPKGNLGYNGEKINELIKKMI